MGLQQLGGRASAVAVAVVPSPWTLALGLTAMAAGLGLVATGGDVGAVASAWAAGPGGGLWSLLGFAMQMCLILVTGHALASAPPVRRALSRLAGVPRSTRSAAVLVSLVAMGLGLLHWGLGLISGAFLAAEVGRRARAEGRPLDYPLVVAAGYTGMAVWHGGLSGSAPLKVTTEAQLADVLGAELAARVGALPLDLTVLSARNLVVTATLLLVVPATLAALAPSGEEAVASPGTAGASGTMAPAEPGREAVPSPTSLAERLDRSVLWLVAPVVLAGVWLVDWARTVGVSRLDPDVMNLTMLTLGLVLHGSPRAWAEAAEEGVRAASGIVLQYPLYGGILGIGMGTGMVASAGAWLGGLGPQALAVATFGLAGAVNLFVPSGGGQWAVQGPALMEAALAAGVDPSHLVLAMAYGDQWTNLIQPFWALPLLGICQVEAGEILGYTLVILGVTGLVFTGGLLLPI